MPAHEIVQVRAYTTGSVPRSLEPAHWVEGQVSSPLAAYPEYRANRASFGIRSLGTLVVEVEDASGEMGVGASGMAGVPACWIVEQQLAPLVEGRDATELNAMYDRMRRGTLHYGRRGIVQHAVSAVDLACWDLLGKIRQEPVFRLIGGPVRDELPMYVTGPHPELAPQYGFIGAKLPLVHPPAEGEAGLRANLEQARSVREKVGEEFWLMVDAWMSLDVDYAIRLGRGLGELGYRWLEEPLSPDDYAGHVRLREAISPGVLVATGEHESTLEGFRLLVELGCCDLVQPDAGWCGGLTEMLRIAALAESRGMLCIPHGLSAAHVHFAFSRPSSPFAECLAPSPAGDDLDPRSWTGQAEWLRPLGGRLRLPEVVGMGEAIDTSSMERPFVH